MITDDFLTDLGAQLRDVRPRRDLRPLAAAVVALIALLAVLAVVPRHHGRPRRPAAGPVVPVAIRNHSGRPEIAPRLPRGFAYKAVEQRPRSDGASFVAPVNGGTMAQARRLGAALGLPLRGPRRFPGNPAARLELSAGPDLIAGAAPVAVLNGTTRSQLAGRFAARLRRDGYHVATVSNAPDQAQRLTTVTAVAPRYEATARALRGLLHADAAPDRLAADRPIAPHAGVLVVLGADQYEPVSDTLPRVAIVDGTGRGDGERFARRLRALGDVVVSVQRSRAPTARTRVFPLGRDPGPAVEVARALGLDGAFSPRRTRTSGVTNNVLVELGRDAHLRP